MAVLSIVKVGEARDGLPMKPSRRRVREFWPNLA